MGADLLKEVISRARSLKLSYELDDPDSKESHPGKTLAEHVEECLELSSEICSILGIEGRFSEFCKLLCSLHDIGKLHPEWKPGVKAVKHSLVSEEVLSGLRGNALKEVTGLCEKEQELLIFMVRNHHSTLRLKGESSYKDYMRLAWLNADLAIGYADSFGAFKLADFASSNGLGESVLEALRKGWPDRSSLSTLLISLDEAKLGLQDSVASSPGHISLTAPTGWGKTMVGLLSAIHGKPAKLFYALPTITAIRKMSDGLRNILGAKEDWLSVGEYFYFVDVDIFRGAVDEDEGKIDESRILDFYRLFIPKVNITTVDQLLLSLLRAGKYHMRRFELRNSILVIDEYHLLPAPMIGALAEALGFYAEKYKMKVVFMTATPLMAYRQAIIDALGSCSIHDLSPEYGKMRRHRIELIGGIDEGVELAEGLLSSGKRVLVILNTVGRAREFYKKLEADSKILLHSRFTVNDRYEKESSIDSCRALVATQVAEVSLDVSFDALITDLAPVPALIQRAGRANRYGKATAGEPNVFIMENIASPEPYHEIEVNYSKDVLREKACLLTEIGEHAYLEMLRDYDNLTRDYLLGEVNEFREKVRKSIFEGNHLLAIGESEEELIRNLRGEANVLVVPPNYESEVRELFTRRRAERSYEGRLRIWAEIKGYLVPVKLWEALKFSDHVEGIPLPVIREENGTYDPELGLLLRSVQ